jgi:DNA-binding YbaB/EbfC family protein
MDMRALMKQAQDMQAKMAKAQEGLAAKTVTAEVAGGQVKVVMNGKYAVVSLEISPAAVDPADVEFLQDLIVSALNEAVRKAEAMIQQEMSQVTGGLSLPGM